MNRQESELYASWITRLREIEKSLVNFDMDCLTPMYLEFKNDGLKVKILNSLSNQEIVKKLEAEKNALILKLKKLGYKD